jgi:putative two-component system response regulator
MSAYCGLLASRLGVGAGRAALIATASLLHDVGKLTVPDQILLKRGPLTAEERRVMQDHTIHGFELLAGSRSELGELAATIALTHHERFDGAGYPRGLDGEQIPLVGRIAAVGDVFDALTSSRPYRVRPYTLDEARAVLRNERGRAFDPEVLDAFVGSFDEVRRISSVGRIRRAPSAAGAATS